MSFSGFDIFITILVTFGFGWILGGLASYKDQSNVLFGFLVLVVALIIGLTHALST